MKPFLILLVTFTVTLLLAKIIQGRWNYIFSGNLAMSVMLVFTGIAHFKYPGGMAMMMPPGITGKINIVYMTGIIEFAAATGLVIPSLRPLTAWLLILFFVCILPANISAAIRKIDYVNATTTGKGINYLWFRVPLQVFFIAWVWWFGIHLETSAP